jgi:hypothetical protein
MPLEKPDKLPYLRDGASFEEHKNAFDHWKSTGQADRVWKESKDAVSHAENWFHGVKHLIEPDKHERINKIITQGRRGMLSGQDVNDQMELLAGSLYPPFDPSDVQMNIPNHLGEQFK